MPLRLDWLEDRSCPTTLPAGFSETLVAGGLTNPTSMALSPDGRVFVTEQTGALRVVENGSLLATPFLSVSVDSSGERGLLGVAFDPNFATTPFVYIYYTVPASGGTAPHNRISRFTANGDVSVGNEQVLVDLDPLSGATNHNGGAIHFGLDGKLYVGVGENANSANSQSLSTRLGKILRYNPDGTIPADNPTTFDGLAGTTTGANRAIWAVGLRNPFTFGIQPGTGRIMIDDVGQSSWEELDDGAAGKNYGWPTTEGTFGQAAFPNFTEPLYAYPHGSGNSAGIAIVGGAFYNPTIPTFPADYAGDYFFGDLANGWISRFDTATQNVENFATNLTLGNLVGVLVAPTGDLLYLARGGGGNSGAVYRIAADTLPPPIVPGPAPVLAGPGPGTAPVVKLFDRLTAAELGTLDVFDATFTGGVRVASGDVTGDGVADLIVGAGPGSAPRVQVLDGTTFQVVRDFNAFESTFTGGVFVAAGDVNGDGRADLVLSPDEGGGPRVRILSGLDGSTIADFFGIEDPAFRGGARTALGDLNRDGTLDLAVAAGFGGGPRVALFDGRSLVTGDTPVKLRGDFFTFEPTLRNGVFVAAGDLDGDGFADLIVGAGPGGGPRVQVLSGSTLTTATPTVLGNFFAGDSTLRGGVRVAVNDLNGDGLADIVVGSGDDSPARVAGYLVDGTLIREWAPFDSSFTGGVYVG
ncbi:MAG TPA: PQQ-dependent sugar dehydrogenase [Fimbriiglobus sp.]|jgi:glucose/arabinose dehydrogenase